MFRKAVSADIPAIAAIYGRILDNEETGAGTTGWKRNIYPTEDTARAALSAGELYVLEEDGTVKAAARINRLQMPEYAAVPWKHTAPDAGVLVLHTLTVDPACAKKGYGTAFVAFYEELARTMGCPCLRMDTNAKNTAARTLYKKLGYEEAGIVPCVFNGIPDVALVCLEKVLT